MLYEWRYSVELTTVGDMSVSKVIFAFAFL